MSAALPVLRALPLSAKAFGTLLDQPASAPGLERGDIAFRNNTADLSGLRGSGVTGHLIVHRPELTLTRIGRHLHTPEALTASAGHAVLLRPGAWHWAPYPLSGAATFPLILRAETSEQDIEMRDIPAHKLEPPASAGSSSPGPSP